jgi:hypothetical protein
MSLKLMRIVQMAINLHAGQTEPYEDLFVDMAHRYTSVCCSRGWGKSYLAGAAAVTAVFELMALDVKVPHKVVYIIAPTYDQVTDIYYPLINYDLGMEHYALSSSKDTGRFIFPNKVELRLISYEAVERMRGKGAYFVVWDEISSCVKGLKPKSAWEGVIQPCITTRWSPKRAAIYGSRSAGRALTSFMRYITTSRPMSSGVPTSMILLIALSLTLKKSND